MEEIGLSKYSPIPLTKSYTPKNGLKYVSRVLGSGHTGGNGFYTQKCHNWFKENFGFKNCWLTSSCTDALEMSALLLEIKAGDEVIIPSYNFPSAANAFLLRGAKVVYISSSACKPNMDIAEFKAAITPKTKAVILLHYAGFADNLSSILSTAKKHGIAVVEDAAHALGAQYEDQWLGSFGDIACFSFHQTKNISCGEGGLIVVNKPELCEKADEIWQMGTNRAAYQRGEVNRYSWKRIGSSFLPSELNAALLLANLEHFQEIQKKRHEVWNRYYQELRGLPKSLIGLPSIPSKNMHSAHIFYIILPTEKLRNKAIKKLKQAGVQSAPHYSYLHIEALQQKEIIAFNNSPGIDFERQLLRLPIYPDLSIAEQKRIISCIHEFVYEIEN
ncbi:dTDP-4-amino-4,6-dideoxygalactose transaminase [Luteibaculum oceani]|uniref:dTDP-4-amino-4,6-dideoxygalactose transaminase n=1 Tax=Luteibaculum oceani TaxID=1294296 RepID=A0A5C6V8Q8_9FLAO|nr:dTDP-4-amino-4,6-dideoxygalactose transaminase [Luteibaculum oceani]TXC81427.1 dTDP-4-amino-4,6-dideoxygalactose transaminase [Luteibaculum oceani]